MNNNLPVRKNIRLKNFDYSQNAAYFITICVEGKRELLGEIFVGDGVLDVPCVQLSKYGMCLEKHIITTNNHYENIEIEKYVVMPNHFHALVLVNNSAVNESGTSGTPSPTNAVIPALVSTLKRFVHKDCGFVLFQRSYHDHIVRDKEEYLKIWKYIDENPLKWAQDCYYVEK